MAQTTNLGRLRARIKKEQEKLGQERGVQAEAPALAQAPIQRGPSQTGAATPVGQDRQRTGTDPAQQRAALQSLAGKATGPLVKMGLRAFQRESEPTTGPYELPPMPADIAGAMPDPGVGGSGFAFDRLPPDTTFDLASPGDLMAPPSFSAQQGLRPDPSQIFETGAPSFNAISPDIGTAPATPSGLSGISASSIGAGLGLGGTLASGLSRLIGEKPSQTPFGAPTLGGIGKLASLGGGIAGAVGGVSSNPYLAGIMAAANIGMTAADSHLSDEDKAKQAAMQAVKAAGAIAAPATFGASMAVTQILDFLNNMDQGMSADEAIVKANDPTAALDISGGGGVSGLLYADSKDWMNFLPGLYKDQGQQGKTFETISKALPYVQNKAELGQLLNSAKNYLGTTTGITPEQFGGSYAGDPYSIGKIPGVGPVTHGQQTKSIDWAQPTRDLQAGIDALMKVLPGDRITAQYGQPGGGLEGGSDSAIRLWNQFFPNTDFAPFQLAKKYSTLVPQYGTVDEGGQQGLIGQQQIDLEAGNYDRSMTQQYGGAPWLAYGQTGYDYGKANIAPPPAGGYQPTDMWTQLTSPQTRPGTPTTQTPLGGALNTLPSAGLAPQGSSGFASLRGPGTELGLAEDPNRL